MAKTWATKCCPGTYKNNYQLCCGIKVQIKSAQIVGPTGSIVRGQRIEEQTKDPIIPPVNNQWPSDHKGVLITFYIKE